jgi:hypothetical protein
VPATFQINVLVLGKFNPAQLVISALAKEVRFGDNAESTTTPFIDLATVIEDDLICKIVLCTDYCQNDSTRVPHVLSDEVQDQLFIRFCLSLVCRMDETREINKIPKSRQLVAK